MLTGLIMQNTSTDVLSMQNSIRIFLLFITKAMLCLVLTLFSFLFRRKKLMISTIQCIAMSCIFLITFLIGVTLERIQTENNIAGWEISAIIGCLIVINSILFFVLCQFSYQNKMKVNHALLNMQIQNEQQKLRDAIRWSTEIETVRHDLKNHLLCISEYICENKLESALQYIQKISDKSQKEIPRRTITKYPALNAILDLKRMICIENNIDFKSFILEEMPDIDDTDFCIVLANLLDNAIDAEVKEKEGEIRLSISTTGNYLRITVQNKISESVLEHNKNLNSSKECSKLHGFGIQSVKETVQKNDGMQEFYEEKGWFIADVMLKINRIK